MSSFAARVPGPYTRLDKLKIIGGAMTCAFLGALDHAILAPALPTIGAEFGAGAGLSWVFTAYLLTSTIGIPVFGKLSDHHGRYRILRIAVLGFIAGSILCALAPGLVTLVVARGIQGLFGGALLALAQIVIADVVTPKERGRYQGYIMAVFAASSFMGPSLGGVLAEFASWRLVFWINLPLGLVAILLADRVLRPLPVRKRSGSIDFAGILFVSAGGAALLLALSLGDDLGWRSWPVLVLSAAGLALWALFVRRARTAAAPFIPLPVLLDPVVARIFLSTVFAVGVSTALSTYLPVYFELVMGFSTSQSGLALIGMSGGTILGSFVGGHLMARLRHYKRPCLVGLAAAVLGALGLAALPAGSAPALLLALTTMVGFGVGTYYPLSTISVQNAAPAPLLGATIGALNFVRAFSQATIVTLFGTLLLGGGAGHAAAPGAGTAELPFAFALVFFICALSFAAALALVAGMREAPLRDTPHEITPPP